MITGDALRAETVVPKCHIINLNPGVVRHEFLASLVAIVAHDAAGSGKIGMIQPMLAGGLLDVYRNSAMETFLYCKHEYLLFLDSDMLVPDDIVDRLMPLCHEDQPVVSALYYMALGEGIRPNAFHRDPLNDGTGRIGMKPYGVDEVPEDTLWEVDGTGCGAMMIHRSVVIKIFEKFGEPMPWFCSQPYDGIIYGEDFDFCMRVADMGYTPVVATGIECGHVKSYILNGTTARSLEQESIHATP